jgi:hypothetical protein
MLAHGQLACPKEKHYNCWSTVTLDDFEYEAKVLRKTSPKAAGLGVSEFFLGMPRRMLDVSSVLLHVWI